MATGSLCPVLIFCGECRFCKEQEYSLCDKRVTVPFQLILCICLEETEFTCYVVQRMVTLLPLPIIPTYLHLFALRCFIMASATSTSNVTTESLYVCRTNDSKAMEHLYGRNICGVFGCKSALSHLTIKMLVGWKWLKLMCALLTA